jgi:hypothetical protein
MMRLAALFGWIGREVLPLCSGKKVLPLIQHQLACVRLARDS